MKNNHYSPALLLAFTLLASTNVHAIDPLSAINRSDPDTVEWRIIGKCLLTPLVEHWIPVAWVETSPSGNFSFIDPVPTTDSRTSVLRSAGLESSSAARIMNFSEGLWRSSNIAIGHHQQVCSLSDAAGGGAFDPGSGGPDCDSGQAVAGIRQLGIQFTAATSGLLSLAYDSSGDAGWASGCRDKARVEAATAANMRCETDMLPSTLQPGGNAAAIEAQKNCLGRWGSLIPRQSRETGLTGPLASAKTAYRAMSTAQSQLKTFPYPVDRNGKMQLSAPGVSGSFRPGDRPLPATIQPNAARAYGWIYWRHVSCCAGG